MEPGDKTTQTHSGMDNTARQLQTHTNRTIGQNLNISQSHRRTDPQTDRRLPCSLQVWAAAWSSCLSSQLFSMSLDQQIVPHRAARHQSVCVRKRRGEEKEEEREGRTRAECLPGGADCSEQINSVS